MALLVWVTLSSKTHVVEFLYVFKWQGIQVVSKATVTVAGGLQKKSFANVHDSPSQTSSKTVPMEHFK